MPGTKAIARRRQRQFHAAFARYAPQRHADVVELLDENALSAWHEAVRVGGMWAAPAHVRAQLRGAA